MDVGIRGFALFALALAVLAGAATAGRAGIAAQPVSPCGANPSPPNAADPSVRVTAPMAGASVVSPLRIAGLARVFEATVSLELRDAAGRTIAEGFITAEEGAPALASFEGTLEFRVATPTPACLWVFETSAADGRPRNVVQVPLTLLPSPMPRYVEAALFLGDPRPCIPEAGTRGCDAVRTGLWNGEARAWATRGVTDPDRRFIETVILRVRAGDPGAIANIARALDQPYLKVTRARFGGADFATVTNLGGGAQTMDGWSLRSPERNLVFRFPAGVMLGPGEERTVCGVCVPPCPARPPGEPMQCPGPDAFQRGFNTPDVFPDDAGRIVLYYDALDLPGDDTRYSADPANQPLPPNLQGVRVAGDPNQRGPLNVILTTSRPEWSPGEPVAFELLLQNLSDQDQSVELRSGQDFDITVSDDAGRVVWRWSDGRIFTQALRTVRVPARGQLTFSAAWDQRDADGRAVPPGRYRAAAVYMTTPRLSSNTVKLTIGSAPRRPGDYAALVEALRAAGEEVEDAGPVSPPILGGDVRALRVAGESVQVHEYPTEAAAAEDAARVSPDASTYRRSVGGLVMNVNVDWVAPPHLYRSGRIIVIYVGRTTALIRLLESLLGPRVAGG